MQGGIAEVWKGEAAPIINTCIDEHVIVTVLILVEGGGIIVIGELRRMSNRMDPIV